MISKMLVAIDHTESSQHALMQASTLARSEKSQVLLLSVVPAYEGDLRMMGNADVLQQMRLPFRNALLQAEKTVKDFDLRLTSVLEEGEPHSSILSLAEREGVDLIVMNRDGHNPVNMLPIGAVTSKVISQSRNDILVIPEKASLNPERILLAYDKTEASGRALKRAIDLSLAYGSELTIATAFEIPLEGFAYSPTIWEKDVEKARQLQEQAAKIAKKGGVRHLKTVLKHGTAASEICKLARSIDAGLIVAGGKPVQSVKKYLPGRVLEKIIRNDTHAVWICKN